MPASENRGVIIYLGSTDSDVAEVALRSALNLLSAAQPDSFPVEVAVHGSAVKVCGFGHSLNPLVQEVIRAGGVVTIRSPLDHPEFRGLLAQPEVPTGEDPRREPG